MVEITSNRETAFVLVEEANKTLAEMERQNILKGDAAILKTNLALFLLMETLLARLETMNDLLESIDKELFRRGGGSVG